MIEVLATLVIVAIVAILGTITSLYLITNGKNDSAQHTLNIAASEAQSYYQEFGSFPTPDTLAPRVPALTVVDGSTSSGLSSNSSTVSIYPHTASEDLLTLAVLSDAGTCFILTVAAPGSTTPDVHATATSANCWAATATTTGTW